MPLNLRTKFIQEKIKVLWIVLTGSTQAVVKTIALIRRILILQSDLGDCFLAISAEVIRTTW